MVCSISSAVKIVLLAQAGHASVAGLVRDAERGEPVAGAAVELSDLERWTITDGKGRYLFEEVPPGPQHIKVSLLGFETRMLHALVPRDGRLEINIDLRPDPIELPGLEVRTLVPVRGFEGADSTSIPDRSVSLAAVHNHPLLAEADFFQALAGGEVALRPESPSGMHVRGGASDQVTYVLDGIPVFSPYHAAGTFTAWSPEALSRVRLSASPATVRYPDALTGVVEAETRAPGPRFGNQGSLSTTQARLTVDGPLGPAGAGYLLSARAGFPGFILPQDEPSYLRSEIGDWLAKLEAPILSGRIRLLFYDSENEIGAAAAAEGPDPGAADLAPPRNEFAWHSQSIGGEWRGSLAGIGLSLQAWRAKGEAAATWRGDSVPERLTAERRDEGLVAEAELGGADLETRIGTRIQRSRSSYVLRDEGDGPRALDLQASSPIVAPFIVHRRPLYGRLRVELAVATPISEGRLYASPRGQVLWQLSSSLWLSGSYARLYQFAQSLRNAESVVSNIFPVEIFVGADAQGVPVARGDQGIAAIEYRPMPGLRLQAQAYARDSRRLVLIAPVDAGPYAATGFTVGSGRARGLALDASLRGARYGAIFGYGFQDVHLAYGDTSYVPDHGSSHLIDAGIIVFPSVTSSIRLGVVGILGRQGTPLASPLEWEACNLLDRGCEFAGSPQNRTEPLGSSSLPAYLRVDIGLRKHWHLRIGGREGTLGLFGTITNVLGRSNVLAVAADAESGDPVWIEMRPRSPLLVGIDWRF